MYKYLVAIVLSSMFCANAFSEDCVDYDENDPNAVVFEGKVIKVDYHLIDGVPIGKDVTFLVQKAIRGVSGETIVVHTRPVAADSLGYPFLCGKSYHVYAEQNHYVNSCMPVEPLSPGMMSADDLEGFLFYDPSVTKEQKDAIYGQMACPNTEH